MTVVRPGAVETHRAETGTHEVENELKGLLEILLDERQSKENKPQAAGRVIELNEKSAAKIQRYEKIREGIDYLFDN